MTDAEFQAVVSASGVKSNKVRAYFCGRSVHQGHRRKIVAALAELGMSPCKSAAEYAAEYAERRAA